jgi:hypothetical protein
MDRLWKFFNSEVDGGGLLARHNRHAGLLIPSDGDQVTPEAQADSKGAGSGEPSRGLLAS